MGRKKLLVKEDKINPLKKKLRIKVKNTNWANTVTLKDLFAHVEYVYASATIVTDNLNISLIVPDADEFLYENGLANKLHLEPFELGEDDLQSEFNRKEKLEIIKVDENNYALGNVGIIPSVTYKYLTQTFPMCVFHQINKWYGKVVNTLVIVLAEEFGKPVAIIKTQE